MSIFKMQFINPSFGDDDDDRSWTDPDDDTGDEDE